MRWARVVAAMTLLPGAGLVVWAPAHGADPEVLTWGYAFSPKDVTVVRGHSVTWVNDHIADHTITAHDGSFDIPLPANARVSQPFGAPGYFPYFCKIHSMEGTVVVQEPTPPPTPPPPTTPPPTTPPPAAAPPATNNPPGQGPGALVLPTTVPAHNPGGLDSMLQQVPDTLPPATVPFVTVPLDPLSTTSTTAAGQVAIHEFGGGGRGAGTALAILGSIGAVLAAGGYAVWRFRRGGY